MEKSQAAQFLLTVFLGPIGLFYSSIAAGLAFCFISVGLALTIGPLVLILVWPASIVAGFLTVSAHNEKVAIENRRHKELVAAAAARPRTK